MASPVVTAKQIKQLSDNLFDKLHIERNGKVGPMDKSIDSRSIWFSKELLDQLFTDNGYKPDAPGYGLRIYFGVHDKANIITDIEDVDDNRLMAALVATKDGDDLLNESAAKSESFDGGGLDNGKICPPFNCGII